MSKLLAIICMSSRTLNLYCCFFIVIFENGNNLDLSSDKVLRENKGIKFILILRTHWDYAPCSTAAKGRPSLNVGGRI